MRLLKTLVIPIFLLISFWAGYVMSFAETPKDSSVTIEAAPSDSEILIDGNNAEGGKTNLPVGTHKITASRDGFSAQSRTITTKFGDKLYVGFILKSSSEDTTNWYENNPSESQLAESISGRVSDYDSQSSARKNSLLQLLPFSYGDGHGGTVDISSGIPLSGTDQPAVYITADTPSDRQDALTWIKNNGVDPSIMDIVFYNELNNYANAD